MSEVSVVGRRRRREASPVDNDDLLCEILLLLPLQPSSLLRASVVCKRWRRLVSDPIFLRRFCAHHRKPPLLGFFSFDGVAAYCFTPMLDPPDRIPATLFSPTQFSSECMLLADCRHGLALFLNRKSPEALVWSPISGHQRRVALPPEFDTTKGDGAIHAVVLCAAGDDDHGHVHGDCDVSSFKLAVVRSGESYQCAFACLYKSKSGVWGNIISTTVINGFINLDKLGVLVGNVFCWLLSGAPKGDILQLDLDMQKLAVVEKPVDRDSPHQIIRTELNSLGLIVLTELSMNLWERKVNSDAAAPVWVLQKTIELGKHLSPWSPIKDTRIQGYDEDHNVIILWTSNSSFMIELDSMRFKECPRSNFLTPYFPYTSFYAADWAIGARDDEPEMSSST